MNTCLAIMVTSFLYRVDECDEKNNVLYNTASNDVDCYRSRPGSKKRKMDSSTPVSWRKEMRFMEELGWWCGI